MPSANAIFPLTTGAVPARLESLADAAAGWLPAPRPTKLIAPKPQPAPLRPPRARPPHSVACAAARACGPLRSTPARPMPRLPTDREDRQGAAGAEEWLQSRQHDVPNGATMISTMLNVKINRHDPTQLHEQVAAEIRRALADGEAKPGERLPAAKDLAAVLGVNTNTVLRALRDLRDEKLLEFRRGRGITVAGTPEQGAVVTRARELVGFARRHGYQLDELVRIIQEVG